MELSDNQYSAVSAAYLAGYETSGKRTAIDCYQIAQSHEFGFSAAKTIREKYGLEI